MLKGCRRGGRQVDVAITLLILDVGIRLLILIILYRVATHFSCHLFYNILQIVNKNGGDRRIEGRSRVR